MAGCEEIGACVMIGKYLPLLMIARFYNESAQNSPPFLHDAEQNCLSQEPSRLQLRLWRIHGDVAPCSRYAFQQHPEVDLRCRCESQVFHSSRWAKDEMAERTHSWCISSWVFICKMDNDPVFGYGNPPPTQDTRLKRVSRLDPYASGFALLSGWEPGLADCGPKGGPCFLGGLVPATCELGRQGTRCAVGGYVPEVGRYELKSAIEALGLT